MHNMFNQFGFSITASEMKKLALAADVESPHFDREQFKQILLNPKFSNCKLPIQIETEVFKKIMKNLKKKASLKKTEDGSPYMPVDINSMLNYIYGQMQLTQLQ